MGSIEGLQIQYIEYKEGCESVPLRYKINVLEALKAAGYNTNRIRKEKLFGESVVQQFRRGEIVSNNALAKLCELLQCQPGDILEYVSDVQESRSDVK